MKPHFFLCDYAQSHPQNPDRALPAEFPAMLRRKLASHVYPATSIRWVTRYGLQLEGLTWLDLETPDIAEERARTQDSSPQSQTRACGLGQAPAQACALTVALFARPKSCGEILHGE